MVERELVLVRKQVSPHITTLTIISKKRRLISFFWKQPSTILLTVGNIPPRQRKNPSAGLKKFLGTELQFHAEKTRVLSGETFWKLGSFSGDSPRLFEKGAAEKNEGAKWLRIMPLLLFMAEVSPRMMIICKNSCIFVRLEWATSAF